MAICRFVAEPVCCVNIEMNDSPSSSRKPRNGGANSNTSLGQLLLSWLGGGHRTRGNGGDLRDSFEEWIEEREGDTQPIDPQERALVLNILALGDREVEDVMVPRADIVAAQAEAGFDDLIALMGKAGHSRLPVYRESLDDVLGVVHIKDLVQYFGDGGSFKLQDLLREVVFVPPSMRVLDLLNRMRATRKHMAIVVDEYGGTDGLVTIENLVEEIVGDIEDEHDEETAPQLVDLGDGTFEADARTPIEDLEDALGFTLADEDEDVDTLGGLVFTLTGRVPSVGEVVEHPAGFSFEVLDADPRRVKRLRIRAADAARTTA